MRKLRYLIVPAIVGAISGSVCAQTVVRQRLSVEQIFQMAEQNNSRIKAHATAVEESREGVKVVKNAYLPSVEASVSLSYNGNGTILDRDFCNPIKAEIPGFGNSLSVEVSQVVYAGGAISNAVRLSEQQSQMAELTAESNRQDVRLYIAGRYLELSKLDNQAKIVDRHIAQTEQVLAHMRKRHEQGTVLHNDITRYELQLQNLRYTRVQIDNARKIQNSHLLVAAGLPADVCIVPDSIAADALPVAQQHEWQARAGASALPVRMAEKAVGMNVSKQKITKAELMPKVALFAYNSLNGPVTIEIPAIDKNFNCWGVGIGISYNIGNLFKTSKKLRAGELAIRRASEERQAASEHTALAVEEACVKYAEACTLRDTKRKSVELATQNYDVVNYRYANGLALITDMLDAAAQKLDAELQLANADINIQYMYFKLRHVAGEL